MSRRRKNKKKLNTKSKQKAKIIIKQRQTTKEEDEAIRSNITLRLCKYLNLPSLIVSHPLLSSTICCRAANTIWNNVNLTIQTLQKLQNLQAEFGAGAVIASFESPEDFMKLRYPIPDYFKICLCKSFDSSWIIGGKGLYFLTNHALQILNVNTQNTVSNQFVFTILVYDNVTNTENHNIFNRIIRPTHKIKQFFGLFGQTIRNVCMLNTESRDLQPLFNDKDTNILFQMMQNRVFSMHSPSSLETIVDNFFPRELFDLFKMGNFNMFGNQKCFSGLFLQNFVQRLDYFIEQNENRFTEMVSLNNKTYQSNKVLLYCVLSQFPFILHGILAIMDIILPDIFVSIFQIYTRSVVDHKKCNAFYKLIEKMQPNYCSHCKREEKRIEQFEKFKICKGCKQMRYCDCYCYCNLT